MENKKICSSKKMDNPYREYLRKAVAVLLTEVGFSSANASAIETLVEMLQSLLISISQSTRDFTELANRTQPTVGDLILALISNQLDFSDIQSYALRPREMVISFKENDKNKPQQALPKVLPLPEKHAYIRTATYAKPPTQYEELRTKAAISKRGVELSLSKYLAKTSQGTVSLFDDDKTHFLLISSSENMSKPSYFHALNPTDQIFDFEELEYYYELRNAKVEDDLERNESYENINGDFIEFDVSPRKVASENEINSEERVELSQPESVEKPVYENPFKKLISK